MTPFLVCLPFGEGKSVKTVLFTLLALALVTGTAALVTFQTQPVAACGGSNCP
jgi:hypothetical protein